MRTQRSTIILRATAALSFSLASIFQADGATFTFTPASAVEIPDNQSSGVALTGVINDPSITAIQSLRVNLTLAGADGGAGGFNGDLYAYLQYDSAITILLNRPGRTATSTFGYSDSGMNVTFADSADTDIHYYRTEFNGGNVTLPVGDVTGLFQPDGRHISPTSSGATMDSADRTALLSGFNGLNPNGTWTLFVADRSSGGLTEITTWGLEITAVPEPHEYALATGVALLGFALFRRSKTVTAETQSTF